MVVVLDRESTHGCRITTLAQLLLEACGFIGALFFLGFAFTCLFSWSLSMLSLRFMGILRGGGICWLQLL